MILAYLFMVLLLGTAVATVWVGVQFREYLSELRPPPESPPEPPPEPSPPKPVPAPPPTRAEIMQKLRDQFDERVALLRFLPVSGEEREEMRLDFERQFAIRAQRLFE